MAEITIADGLSGLGKAVINYGSKFIKSTKDTHLRYNAWANCKYSNQADADEINLVLPFGKSFIEYQNEILEINVTKYGTPKDFSSFRGYYTEITIKSTSPNGVEVIKGFLDKAKDYYTKYVLDREPRNGKVTCYIYDEYWVVLNKYSKRKISSIYLNNNIEKDVLEDMRTFLSKETEEKYLELGIPYKKNYLFEGYPGTGKTSLVYALASELKLGVAVINFDHKMTDNEFMRAIKKIPEDTILVLEDIDILFQERKKADELKSSITFSGLLNSLDGIAHQDKLVTIMTTNYKCSLDIALRRPGRIDYQVHFDFAKEDQIKNMFVKFFPKQTGSFKEFYKRIQRKNLTTAMLQQYFFKNLYCENIMDNIDELINLADEHDYQDKSKHLYS